MANQQYCIHGEENCNRCAMNEVEAPTINLHIVLDISTSMCARWNQTISGLNEYIAALRLDSNAYKVTITKFGLENEVEDLYTDADLDKIQKFDAVSFYPNGRGTALWGAVGISLSKIDTGQPVLFVVITDGEENSSLTYTSESVNKLIEERKKLGNYTFAYMGVDKAAWGQEAKVLAFRGSNQKVTAAQYGADTYRSLAAVTCCYASTMTSNNALGRSMSVGNLFDPNSDNEDLSSVKVTSSKGAPPGVAPASWTTGK